MGPPNISDSRAVRQAANERMAAGRMAELKEHCGIEGLHKEKTFETWIPHRASQEPVKSLLIEWAESFPDPKLPWLAFCGGTGSGKSHMGMAIANHICENPGVKNPHFIKLIGMMRRIRSTYGGNSQRTEEEVVRSFQRVGLLILDEFGLKEKLSDWEGATLDDILDTRWEQRRPTIIITNLIAKRFLDMAGERIASRFTDLGRVINFTWPDYRVEKRKESGRG